MELLVENINQKARTAQHKLDKQCLAVVITPTKSHVFPVRNKIDKTLNVFVKRDWYFEDASAQFK